MVTAQSRWSRKKKKQGKCSRCGSPRNRYRQLCDRHQKEFTQYMREWRRQQKEPNADNSRSSSQGHSNIA